VEEELESEDRLTKLLRWGKVAPSLAEARMLLKASVQLRQAAIAVLS
jgi:hypothetical protein